MRRVGLLVIVVGACASEPGPSVAGSPSDVTTASGSYAGYRVVRPCPTSFSDVGVVGTGATAITDVDAISAFGQDLHAQLADIPSIWGWAGYGLVCEPGVGSEIELDDWRDVDTVIERVGAYLRTRDVALQVGINVDSIPVPVSGSF